MSGARVVHAHVRMNHHLAIIPDPRLYAGDTGQCTLSLLEPCVKSTAALRHWNEVCAILAGAKASKQPAAKRMPSAAKQRPRYNVPVVFMSRGVVDPYEVEQAVIEPPRRAAAPDQAALPLPVELPSSRSGLGAQPSCMETHLEEDVSLSGIASPSTEPPQATPNNTAVDICCFLHLLSVMLRA